MGRVLALVDDVFFQAKMMETAKRLGVELQTVGNGKQFLSKLLEEDPSLLIVDLNAQSEAIEVLEHVKAAGARVPMVAFLSHVQVDLADRARAAGCTEVMPRSKFTKNLAAILSRAGGKAK